MANRRKPKYVPGWFTEQQHAKLAAMATLKGSSVNGVLCELVDAVGVEIVMPSATNVRPSTSSSETKNDAGGTQHGSNREMVLA
jgi:hypothetical protein